MSFAAGFAPRVLQTAHAIKVARFAQTHLRVRREHNVTPSRLRSVRELIYACAAAAKRA